METEVTTEKKSKLGFRSWVAIWIAGLIGQLTWVIENTFFNTYVYDQIAPNSTIITWMVAISAIVSTFSTFLMGTFSDRLGKRRVFVLIGYVLWGVFTIIFGLTQFTVGLLGVTGAAVLVVIADAIMSFFGSMGNDCGFNAWTTDISNPENRGTLGTSIALQPVLATIVGTVVFGAILGAFSDFTVDVGGYTQTLDYFMLFIIVGVVTIGVGIASFFLMKESPNLFPTRNEKFGRHLAKPFNFKLLKENKLLLYILLIFMCFFISFNIYFPHILNYFIYGDLSTTINWLCDVFNLPGNEEMIAGALEAIALVLAVPLLILAGRFHNKNKFISILFISICMNLVGLLILFFGGLSGVEYVPALIICLIGMFFVGGGYMGLYQAIMVWLKNLFPEGMRSQFEGVRMIFYVCIPMFLGTLIGNFIIQYLGTPITLTYATGDLDGFAPNYWLFIFAFGVCLLCFIPLVLATLEVRKNPPSYQKEEQ